MVMEGIVGVGVEEPTV